MPYLAARVPAGWEVAHIDEEAETIDFDAPADVVALTFHTPSAYHAYEIAARFRSRGACVAMGGPHVSLLPEEAAQHADVLFAGEAEGVWEEFLRDFEPGRHRLLYRRDSAAPLDNIPMSSKALFHRNDHTSGVLFATRGCPYQCDFCAIHVMYRRGQRRRPVEEVAAEYASFPGKIIIFWDEDIAADPHYAKRLFDAIAPYGKWWSSQAGVNSVRDDAVLDAAARSGCKQLFLGLESLSQASVSDVHKGFNRVDEYARTIARVHAHGIAVQAGIVFGFDGDSVETFRPTLDFLEAAGVENATFNILTPWPGTPLFQRLEAENRILTRDWRRYNGRNDVVFQPKQMSAEELLSGFRWANDCFYSVPSMVRRLSHSRAQLWWTLPLNLAYTMQLALVRFRRPVPVSEQRDPVVC